jgi:hypothetical protein
MRFALLVGFLLATAATALDLTPDNFDENVLNGKGSFVKFLAPW